MTTTNHDFTEQERRVEWLDEFHASISLARVARSDLAYLAGIMDEAGNEKLSERLEQLGEILSKSIEGADGAIGRMISEYAQESWNSIGETFKALLDTLPKEGT